MPAADADRRAHLERIFRLARYRVLAEGVWRPVERLAGGPWAVVTAWNPRSRVLPAAMNRQRDRALQRWLAAHGVAPCRPARGTGRDGCWREDGWCIPHRQARTAVLLRRFAQHAAWVVEGGRGFLVWSRPG